MLKVPHLGLSFCRIAMLCQLALFHISMLCDDAMRFTFLWFACLPTPLVTSSAIPRNEVRRRTAYTHVVEAVASPLSIRQQQSQKNVTTVLGASATKWTVVSTAEVLSKSLSSAMPPPAPNTSRQDFTFSNDIQLTKQVEVSRTVMATPSTLATSYVEAPSSNFTSRVTISVQSEETIPPEASSSERRSSRDSFEETWYQTSFVTTTMSFYAPLPVVTSDVSFLASMGQYISSSARSSQDDSTISPSLVSTPLSSVAYATSFSTTSNTGTFTSSSKTTVSLVAAPIESRRPLYIAITPPGSSHLLTGFTSNSLLSTSRSSISAIHSTDACAMLKPSVSAQSPQASLPPFPIATTSVPSMTTTPLNLHQPSAKNEPVHLAWKATAAFNITRPTGRFNSTAKSTKLIASPGRTSLDASYTSAVSNRDIYTTASSVLNLTVACDSTLSIEVSVPVTNLDTKAKSTSTPHNSDSGTTWSATTVFSPSGFATESVAASPPLPPPLTASQTAGMAIAGAAGFLIAAIAAMYVARRYRNKHFRRTSNASVYPKAAYLYDPPAHGGRDVANLEEPYIPSRTTDTWVQSRNTTTSVTLLDRDYRYSSVSPADQSSDLGDTFLDSDIIIDYPSRELCHSAQRSTDIVAIVSTTAKEHKAVSQNISTTLADASRGDVAHEMRQPRCVYAAMTKPSLPRRGSSDALTSQRLSHRCQYAAANFHTGQAVTTYGTWSSPMTSTGMDSASRMTSRRSILNEITSVAYNDDDYSHDSRHQSSPKVNLDSNHSLSDARETLYTDSWRDPFEHDLFLQADTYSETADSMAIFASSGTNEQTVRSITPLKACSKDRWPSSTASRTQAKGSLQSSRGVVTKDVDSLDAVIAIPERSSPAYNSFSHTKIFGADLIESSNTVRSVSPLAGVTHRGWDDIKRFSIERVVPSVPTLSPLQEALSSSLRKKASLFYL